MSVLTFIQIIINDANSFLKAPLPEIAHTHEDSSMD